MATTPNLGLHQWGADDSFLRTDFNEDFRKIDGAVGDTAAANCSVRLLKVTTTTAARQVDLDLSGYDLTKFRTLTVRLAPLGETSSNCSVRFNGSSQQNYYWSTGYLSGSYPSSWSSSLSICDMSTAQNPSLSQFTLELSKGIPLYGRVLLKRSTSCYEGYVLNSAITPEALRSINLLCSVANILPGSELEVWGVKL